ncbi:TfoX/Sxy family protein [Georgenia wangjunii]|uniref:TfoX/Sxy family protein n=1 Tax=Georgenia wangjunii TaxID=3117730 RepID=UPI002F26123D
MAYDMDLAARVRALLQDRDGVSERAMFGGLAFLVGGHMGVAVGPDGGLMLRVDPAATAALLGEPHVSPTEMGGRELTGWVDVDTTALGSDAELRRWVTLGMDTAASMPPKP